MMPAAILAMLLFLLLDPWLKDRDKELPRFFNDSPIHCKGIVLNLLAETRGPAPTSSAPSASLQSTQTAALRSLVDLGTASFPYLIPRLETLSKAEREHIAHAFLPVLTRARLIREFELSRVDSSDIDASLILVRIWQDRSSDYRESLVRRGLKRYLESPTPGRLRELIEYDTYALPLYFEQLIKDEQRADPKDLSKILPLLTRLNIPSLPICREATDKLACIARLNDWWRDHRGLYTDVYGLEKMGTNLTETRFAKFIERSYSQLSMFVRSLINVSSPIHLAVRHTSIRLLFPMALAIVFGSFTAIRYGHRGRRYRIRRLLALQLSLIPAFYLVPSYIWANGKTAFAVTLEMALLATAIFYRRFIEHLSHLQEPSSNLQFTALGATPSALAKRRLPALIPNLLRSLQQDLPVILGFGIVVESLLGLDGIGTKLFKAISAKQPYESALWLFSTIALTTIIGIISRSIALSLERRYRL